MRKGMKQISYLAVLKASCEKIRLKHSPRLRDLTWRFSSNSITTSAAPSNPKAEVKMIEVCRVSNSSIMLKGKFLLINYSSRGKCFWKAVLYLANLGWRIIFVVSLFIMSPFWKSCLCRSYYRSVFSIALAPRFPWSREKSRWETAQTGASQTPPYQGTCSWRHIVL